MKLKLCSFLLVAIHLYSALAVSSPSYSVPCPVSYKGYYLCVRDGWNQDCGVINVYSPGSYEHKNIGVKWSKKPCESIGAAYGAYFGNSNCYVWYFPDKYPQCIANEHQSDHSSLEYGEHW